MTFDFCACVGVGSGGQPPHPRGILTKKKQGAVA